PTPSSSISPLSLHDALPILVGPVRLTLHGHDFAFSGIANTRSLFVDGTEVQLDGSSITQLGHDRLGVFREGEYVHLRLRDEGRRSEEHTSELQSRENLVCRL